MHSSFRLLQCKLRSLAILLAIACSLSAAQAQSLQISGHVLNAADKSPVQCSVVLFSLSNSANGGMTAITKAVTDAKGTYVFNSGVAPNVVYVVAAYPYDPQFSTTYYPSATDLSLAEKITLNQNRSDVDILLQGMKTYDNLISGIVQDAKGNKLDAQVFIQSANTINSQSYIAVTDKVNTGSFEAKNLQPGTYVLLAVPNNSSFASGYYRLNNLAAADQSQATLVKVGASGTVSPAPVIILDNASNTVTKATIKGMVVDEFKQPLAGVELHIYDASGQELSGTQGLVSDKGGMFVWSGDNVSAGTYVVMAQLQGYTSVTMTFTISDKNPSVSLVLLMQSDNTVVYKNAISGVVRDVNGKNIPATVLLLPVLADGSVSFNSTTSKSHTAADGSFSITNIHPGRYALWASPDMNSLSPGYFLDGKTASQNPLDATHLDVSETSRNANPYIIILDRAQQSTSYDLYAMVVDDQQQPLEGVVFTATDAQGNQVLANQLCTTDAHGYVHLAFPGVGTYTVNGTKQGYVDATGTVSFSTWIWAQKAMIVMPKKNGTNGSDNAKIVAGVGDNVDIVDALYPQPAESVLNLRLSSGQSFDRVEIYSLSGERVQVQDMQASSVASISLQGLSAGSYELRLLNNGRVQSSRIFVKN